MIFIDFNNISMMKYSLVQKEVLGPAKDTFKKTGIVEVSSKDLDNLRKGFFNLVLKDLLYYQDRFMTNYNGLVIANDFSRSTYWRKSIYPDYKTNRDKPKQNSFEEIQWSKFWSHKKELLEIIKSLGIKVMEEIEFTTEEFGTETAEADDIIGVLTRMQGRHLIISSDGDFDQLLHDNRIRRYDPMAGKLKDITKKEINEKNTYNLIMGQSKDNIPHVKERSSLTDEFISWMKSKYQIELTRDMASTIDSPKYKNYVEEYTKEMFIEDSKLLAEGKRKKRRNLTPFEKPNFGEVAYNNTFEHMSVDEFLSQNPVYRKNYELNKKLYLLSEIPSRVIEAIGRAYLKNTPDNDSAAAFQLFMANGLDLSLAYRFK